MRLVVFVVVCSQSSVRVGRNSTVVINSTMMINFQKYETTSCSKVKCCFYDLSTSKADKCLLLAVPRFELESSVMEEIVEDLSGKTPSHLQKPKCLMITMLISPMSLFHIVLTTLCRCIPNFVGRRQYWPIAHYNKHIAFLLTLFTTARDSQCDTRSCSI